MINKLKSFSNFLTLRNALIIIAASFLIFALNLKWQDMLRVSLSEKNDELQESFSLLNAKAELQNRQDEMAMFQALKSSSMDDSWKDAIPSLVSEQKLILRQVRPLGVEQRGKLKEEKVFLQVEGDINGVMGFLHAVGASEVPIYVGQVLVTTQAPGSGFISAELVLVKPIL